ncbi:glycosyltransferase family 2 protein [Halarchaeum sp. P4]|uniref:glycosyltransferase family 2 protein n=1 Tax=Halarchaeum sp. P4 TaxID=3421639 RepID=UPI003EBF96DC
MSRLPAAPDRLLAGTFALALTSAVVVALHGRGHPFVTDVLRPTAYVALWAFLGIYGVATAFWTYEVLTSWREYEPPDVVYGPEDCQIRILTVDAEAVVQETVNAIPDGVAPGDRHVIAEEPMDIEGAEVHVVPEGFESLAGDKGRALEWARQRLDCEREFVLFLDEDTSVREFDGFPDADIVQFREWPEYTGSTLAFWCELVRIGYQAEQQGFGLPNVPLYAWGGGIAVRSTLEDEVTWDYPTLIEDTVFVWRAVIEHGAEYVVMPDRFRNQAPPSIRALVHQRRRWLAGSLRDEPVLPRRYWALFVFRNVTWAFSPVAPFLLFFLGFLPGTMPYRGLYTLLSWALLAYTLVWLGRAWRYYDGLPYRHLLAVPLYPLVVSLHSLGAAWGLVDEPEGFEPTEKEVGQE